VKRERSALLPMGMRKRLRKSATMMPSLPLKRAPCPIFWRSTALLGELGRGPPWFQVRRMASRQSLAGMSKRQVRVEGQTSGW